jgi:hypothetical protein
MYEKKVYEEYQVKLFCFILYTRKTFNFDEYISTIKNEIYKKIVNYKNNNIVHCIDFPLVAVHGTSKKNILKIEKDGFVPVERFGIFTYEHELVTGQFSGIYSYYFFQSICWAINREFNEEFGGCDSSFREFSLLVCVFKKIEI